MCKQGETDDLENEREIRILRKKKKNSRNTVQWLPLHRVREIKKKKK